MKTFVTLAAFAAGTNALVSRGNSCCFHMTAAGGASGTIGQLSDGQSRVYGNLSPADFCIDSQGGVTDGHGRGCIITPDTTQWQCDEGSSPANGFSVGSEGQIEYKGNTKFVACQTGLNGGMNLYINPDRSLVTGCTDITLSADSCSGQGSGSGEGSSSAPPSASTAPAGSPPAGGSSVPGGGSPPTPVPTVPGGGSESSVPVPPAGGSSTVPAGPPAGSPPAGGSSVPGGGSPPTPVPTVPGGGSESSVPVPPVGGSSTAPAGPPAGGSSVPGGGSPPTPVPTVPGGGSESSVPVPPAAGSSTAPGGGSESVPPVPGTTAPVVPGGGEGFTTIHTTLTTTFCPESESTGVIPGPQTSVPGSPGSPSESVPAQPTESVPAQPSESVPAQPSETVPGSPSESVPAQSSQTVTGSQPSETPSSPSESVPASGTSTGSQPSATPSGSCPANLDGEYEAPHLIIPVNSESPDKAYGSSFNGTISTTESTLYNFDIPSKDAGKTCSLVFLFPKKEDLETSSFTFSGDGKVDFSQLDSSVSIKTNYQNTPAVKEDYGVKTLSPGNSYTIATFECPAGQAVAYEMKNAGSTYLDFFEDYNPSP
ncbi:hypothetical protein ASPWEDRAFT_47606 [Aspergillus wentii DTO 134E9]|uniref:Uncharacterized protein n=1 Tax=Aspergillus wentii DTO 134E9 TaxID=1073089 RepID=A0A1L9S137_ASPWE|nr:uncharacterized protein ASPWEDRAFT_47606 [Aspergillus wentii DTO 134E9]OJJ40895.1 hypothetical protein ASPWEDRAFT_47606 [Aspergillus wentii DTO 134E9]